MENKFENEQNVQTEAVSLEAPAPAAPALTPQQILRRKNYAFQKDINFTTGGLLIYLGIINIVVFFWFFVSAVIYILKYHPTDSEEAVSYLLTSLTEGGGSMLAAVTVGVLFLALFFHKRRPISSLWQKQGTMAAGKFFQLFFVMGGIQLIFSGFSILLEMILNQFGLSLQAANELASGQSTTITMAIYIVLGAPITEEIVFRGFQMQSFREYGKLFAIIFSAVLFGIMHANPVQSIYAVFVGIVLGYAATEYGLFWSILLHTVNNLLFGLGLSTLGSKLPEHGQEILEYGVLGVFFVIGLIVVIRKRSFIAEYIRTNRTSKKRYVLAFSTVCTIIFVVINVLLAASQVESL